MGGRWSYRSGNRRQVRLRSGPAEEERVTGVRVKPRLETLALQSLAQRSEERTRPGMLTCVARPFGTPSIGFPAHPSRTTGRRG
jgi:hypothetical protein